MIYITEVHMSKNGNGHEQIESLRWEHRGSPEETGESSREEMIEWIENKAGFVHVRDRDRKGKDIPVHIVHPKKGHPYLRTNPDGENWRDDLLDLPRYGVIPGDVA